MASAVVFFELVDRPRVAGGRCSTPARRPAVLRAVGVGGLLWFASTLLPLFDYRHRTDTAAGGLATPPRAPDRRRPVRLGRRSDHRELACWASCPCSSGHAAELAAGRAPSGGARRDRSCSSRCLVVDVATRSAARTAALRTASSWVVLGSTPHSCPTMTVSSLWWWDVLVTLDRARASEARLAATQERLRSRRTCTTCRDTTSRSSPSSSSSPSGSCPGTRRRHWRQLRAARASVDDARQGTRDLATRFRSVPLRDELANAVDLLRAGGTKAEAAVDPTRRRRRRPPSGLSSVRRRRTCCATAAARGRASRSRGRTGRGATRSPTMSPHDAAPYRP